MNKIRSTLCIVALLPTLNTLALFNKVPGIDSARIRCVAVSPNQPSFMAASSDNSLYMSKDQGTTFSKTAVFKDEHIAHIFIDPILPNTVYLAGSRHGYKIGETTEKIFSARAEERINFIARHQGRMYMATSKGLYHAEDSLLNWKTVPGLQNNAVYSVKGFGNNVYLCSDSGVYRFRPEDGTLIRIFTSRGNGAAQNFTPLIIETDALTPTRLWMGTSKGVYRSTDRGETWQKFYITGADHISVHCLRMAPLDNHHFYLCTDAGFYKINIDDGTSKPLYEGLTTSQINWMDFSADHHIYLATDKGLFKKNTNRAPAPTAKITLREITRGEPSIHEIQEAALHYNSVHPDTITEWKRKIKYRALAPTLSLDYDNNIRGSSKDGQYHFAEGPKEWGVSLSWDLDELLWSSQETSIDNRNKLMTQLRTDILDDVNRIYFERLRIKREIAQIDPLSEEIYPKELRLYELTATLDGYTGGFFSEECANL